MNYITHCLLILFSYALPAQKTLTPDQLLQDFSIFENILKQAHPVLYEYTEKKELDSLFSYYKEKLKEEKTDLELYKIFTEISDQVKDGNLIINPPEIFDITNNCFPLITKIIHPHLYTDTDDYDIPIGSKILEINGIKTSKILQRFLRYAPSDGNNQTRKYRDIESKFSLYYSYEYGPCKQFFVLYETPSKEIKTITLSSESFAEVKQRETKRNSYFSKYHYKKNDIDFYSEHINAKKPFVYYPGDSKTAILKVNSFEIPPKEFTFVINKLFDHLKKEKTKHLIIDIRQNTGGFRTNALYLFSLITKSFFKQRISTYVSSLKVPEKTYISRTYFNEREYLTDPYKNHITMDGWESDFDNLQPIMVPRRDRYQGKIYVLISGKTFSTGTAFAQLTKNDSEILLIGEESGGNYYMNTGDYPVSYKLPNSKIQLKFHMVKINNYITDKSNPRDKGVLPDRKIYLKRQDLIDGKDAVLDYTLRLIKR